VDTAHTLRNRVANNNSMIKPILISLLSLITATNFAASNPYLHEVSADGKLEFKLEDKLRLQAFAWPRTLLSYAVKFNTLPQAVRLRLRDLGTGQDVAFQLSGVKDNMAFVNFFADLPSGGVRRFELSNGGTRAVVVAGVKQIAEGNTIVLDAGKLKVRLPASQTIAGKVPGPILQVNQFGDSTLVSPKRAVKAIITETIETGPLFIACRVTYQFDGGGRYIAIVKAIADYDYVEFNEEIIGLSKEDNVFVETVWTNLHPTHRMVVGSPFGGTRRVDEPMVQPFRGEDPAFTGPSRIEDPSVEMLASLTPYWPNGWGGNRSASFWDEKSGDAVGVFIADASKWQDHEYAIWTSADTAKVKYRYANNVLFWKWPLVTGTRLTGVTAYKHSSAEQAVLADQTLDKAGDDRFAVGEKLMELPRRLQIQYGDISLNRVKDWILDYPEMAKRPPTSAMKPGRQKTMEAYMKALPTCAMTDVAIGMFHPVGLRDMGYWVVPDFLRYREAMTPEQRAQATAVLLFTAYVAAEDEYCPMRTMLGGHPNFMADLKFPIAAAAFLFPEHPLASEWRDQYEKFMELCGHFYVRPAVPAWEARGGRFTESIATYNWAFMGPTSDANHLGRVTGARNFYATPQLAGMGDYLVGILTSPQVTNNHTVVSGAPPTWENGYKRLHPPQGAHSSKRGAGGPMYTIGEQLRNYRPLTAEHLMWGAFPAAGKGFEDRNGTEVGTVNRGTNPHLTSAKYTGYGIVLRAGVDTPEEMSVFLQQVDKGPNYRWGYANQNGSGDIYYYAGGKSYSGHEREEAGDGHVDDAMFSSNTGVYKDWHFWCIGMNELTRPFYNLGVAQFAEIVPQTGSGAYAWPEYQSRSVMLVGTDYIVTYDQILDGCGTRFAWNICRDDEMPFIQHIKGGGDPVNLVLPKDGFVRGSLSTMIKGGNSHMALVTHKSDVKIIPNKRVKGLPPLPYVRIATPGSEDLIFQGDSDIQYADTKISFTGRAGVIRQRKNGQTEMSLFHGTHIGAKDVTITVDNPELGISATFTKPTELAGTFFSRTGGMLVLKTPGTGTFYVDGAPSSFKLPPGEHRWEFTSRLPEPMPPVMLRTENRAGGATIFFTQVAGAEKYRMELSADNGTTWKPIGETASDRFELNGLDNDIKIHIRATALNSERQGQPANEYPLYVTSKPPLPPDGFKTVLGTNEVKLTWGEVLGVTEYRLYCRERGQTAFTEIFRGRANQFNDRRANLIPAFSSPGQAANLTRSSAAVYEYAITAVTGNGESVKSLLADTDPTSWRNWNPTADLRYKRQSAFWQPPYVRPEDVPPPYYPQ